MVEYYSNIKPKMNDFDIQIRIDVVATKVIVGTQINVDDLSKERHFLRFRNAVTIKTNLAYAMVRCANISIGDLVVDVSYYSGICIALSRTISDTLTHRLVYPFSNHTALLW